MSKPRRFLPLTALIAGFAFATSGLSAQTLARPGWVGSGMTAQTWFRHAVIYQIDTRSFQDSNRDGIGDLKGITERLDYIRSLGADAILLAPLTPSGGPANAIDPVLGTLDDLDDLTLQASRVKIRILLELPDPDPALARFWLSRGLAGFQIPALNSSKQSNSAAIQAIRKLLPGYVGQRVLITDAEPAAAAANPAVAGKPAGNELVLDTALLKLPAPTNSSSDSTPHPQAAPAANSTIAGQLRAALEAAHALARPESLLLAADAPGVPRSLDRFAANGSAPGHASDMGRIVTTVLMLSHSGVLLSAGEELALQSSSGTDVTIPWGAPPATSPPPAEDQPASASAAAPSRPGARDVYVPYVAPKTAAKPPTEAPPDPASAAGQESNPKSPLNFYRQLNQLRHGGTALRDGDVAYLDFDALNALVWIRRPASPTYANPPIVILCNLSGIPVTIELKPELLRLHLRGSFLKTILRSDSGMGAMDISPVHLPPYTVYVGELKF